MRANKEYLRCFLWRRGVWLAPLGLLLVPLLMLNGQDNGSWHASPKPVVDSPWPAGQETAPVSGWGRRPLTAAESIRGRQEKRREERGLPPKDLPSDPRARP